MEQPAGSAPSPEAYFAALVTDASPEEAAVRLANLVARAATELHRHARAEAQARRGQSEWGRWAKLANAARGTVLQAATCRDAAR
jgi:hypothetical protein